MTNNEIIETLFLYIYCIGVFIFGECIALSRYGTLTSFYANRTELVIGLGILFLLFGAAPLIVSVASLIGEYKDRRAIKKKHSI